MGEYSVLQSSKNQLVQPWKLIKIALTSFAVALQVSIPRTLMIIIRIK
jgi:hypothetical protein